MKLHLFIRWIKSNVDILLWIAFLLFIISIFIVKLGKKPPDPIDVSVRVYVADTSLSKSMKSSEKLAHNNLVIHILQTRATTCTNVGVSRENNLKQTRTIYVVLISVLLALILNGKKNKSIVILLILFLIVGMYLVEVHVQDLHARQSGSCSIVHRSVDSLVNSRFIDSIWYGLNYVKYHAQEDTASYYRSKRKIWSAYDPDGEQYGFYVAPFIAIYSYLLWVIRRKKKGANSDDNA